MISARLLPSKPCNWHSHIPGVRRCHVGTWDTDLASTAADPPTEPSRDHRPCGKPKSPEDKTKCETMRNRMKHESTVNESQKLKNQSLTYLCVFFFNNDIVWSGSVCSPKNSDMKAHKRLNAPRSRYRVLLVSLLLP